MSRDIELGNPATLPEEDEFGRWPFCQALADRLATLGSLEGAAVVGLDGRWGYGKSTVLNFVKRRLADEHADKVVVVNFNPWFFANQQSLLEKFYETLAEALAIEKSELEAITGFASKYSGAFAMIPVVGGGVSRLAEQLGKSTQRSVADQREKIERLLCDDRPTIIVLIDDVDRLDHDELMTMLKLVRLNLSLPKIVYVMAFDEEAVARSIGKGMTDAQAGRNFLEKIVQFSFSIPAVGYDRLIGFTMNHMQEACQKAEIYLTDDEKELFRKMVGPALSANLRTPRQAIRYGSALKFAMPMLSGEVDAIQQMIVEGLRIIFPDVYMWIRDDPSILQEGLEVDQIAMRVGAMMKGVRKEEITAVTKLLELLLSQREVVKQPILDRDYFDRYFQYAIPPDDIRHSELDVAVRSIFEDDPQADRMLSALARRNPVRLVKLLTNVISSFAVDDRELMTKAVGRIGASFAMTTPFSGDPLAHDVARLLAYGVERIASSFEVSGGNEERLQELILQLIECADPPILASIFLDELLDGQNNICLF